jgi:3-hydroxyacyl-CoA dehydrogenase
MSDFRKVGVIGAGVMGSGIAAHLAGAGLEVLLVDIVPPDGKGARNAFAQGGKDKALKAKPAAFFSPRDAERVTVGNVEDDLAAVAQCDLVIEVVTEDLAI